MKIKITLLVSFFFVLQLTATTVNAQQLPDWVLELKKPTTNFLVLKDKFNTYWKDKMEEDESNSIESEEDEFPIQKEYGWLRIYVREYLELIHLGRYNNIAPLAVAQQRSIQAQSALGNWSCNGPFDYPKDTNLVWGGIPRL